MTLRGKFMHRIIVSHLVSGGSTSRYGDEMPVFEDAEYNGFVEQRTFKEDAAGGTGEELDKYVIILPPEAVVDADSLLEWANAPAGARKFICIGSPFMVHGRNGFDHIEVKVREA